MLLARYVGAGEYVMTFTLVASSSYVLVGLLAGGLRTWYGRLCLAGLVFCWMGDVLGPSSFVTGLYAFLLAHLSFSAAFLTRRMDWRRVGLAMLPVFLATGTTGLMLWPHVQPSEHVPFILYSTVISTMVVLSFGISKESRLVLAAAIIFFVSDILVARWRYAESQIDGYLCYILYYTSCLLFAYSARPVPTQSDSPAPR
jgi:uncharacterized membrane protein YhhN